MTKRRTVLTIGTFDLLHYGHVDFLQIVASLGKNLTVGVNTDEFVASFKRPPTMSLEERIYALGQHGYLTMPNASAGRDLIEAAEPGILAVGSDWARKDYLSQINCTQDWLDKRRIVLAYVPYVHFKQISTTEILRRVKQQ